jgi:hypothetical protein
MDDGTTKNTSEDGTSDIRSVIRQTVDEFVQKEQSKTEPVYKTELLEERKRREQLERRLNELVEENRRARQAAEEAERNSAVRTELQRLGVAKVDLAYRAVKDDVFRLEDGRLMGRTDSGDASLREYLTRFINDNPEFLPARITGGSGVTGGARPAPVRGGESVDIDRIRPGMSAEDVERTRQEILRVASQTLKGL